MKLNILCCVTDNIRYIWEARVLLTNLREFGHSGQLALLIFQHKTPIEKEFSSEWRELAEEFPEAKFVYYKDTQNISRSCQIFNYSSLFRLYVLQEYFKTNKHLQEEAIFYIDSDIILTKPIDFEQFLQDDINYLSWTGSPNRTDNYLWQPYFDSKRVQVVEARLPQYDKLDPLAKVAEICGTTRECITLNSPNIGGAQYLLKNIDSQFWTDCFNASCEIKLYLSGINQIFFKGDDHIQRENNGFQSWCADMWALAFCLLGKGREIRTPKELDFAWSCDRIERADTTSLCHDAGITSDAKVRVAFEKLSDGTNRFEDCPMFLKSKYDNKFPIEDLQGLKELYNNPLNKKFCNNIYLGALLKTIE